MYSSFYLKLDHFHKQLNLSKLCNRLFELEQRIGLLCDKICNNFKVVECFKIKCLTTFGTPKFRKIAKNINFQFSCKR